MNIGIPKESLRGENRVASSPNAVKALIKLGFNVQVQKGAGVKASFTDQEFIDAGAEIVTKKKCWENKVIFKVNAPTLDEASQLVEGATLVSFIAPAQSPELLDHLKEKSVKTGAAEQTFVPLRIIKFR